MSQIALKNVADQIKRASRIMISTHKHLDGDGLGSELALYHALKKIQKDVRILNLDQVPSRYTFLNTKKYLQAYQSEPSPLQKTDLALIVDTNDSRLLGDLFTKMEELCENILFIDHHLPVKNGPSPTEGSYIDVNAASTGEMVFHLIKELNIPLDKDIARALYASIIFDTQFFRYIRNSAESHRIAVELLEYEKQPMEVSQNIFGNYTVNKLKFLSKVLGSVEYSNNQRSAFLTIKQEDILGHELTYDDSLDVIDMVMNVKSLEVAVLFLEMEDKRRYKISLRSKGKINVSTIADDLGGGGHFYSSGAFVEGDVASIKSQIIGSLEKQIISD